MLQLGSSKFIVQKVLSGLCVGSKLTVLLHGHGNVLSVGWLVVHSLVCILILVDPLVAINTMYPSALKFTGRYSCSHQPQI
jgi:hypothetical protein